MLQSYIDGEVQELMKSNKEWSEGNEFYRWRATRVYLIQ